MLTSHLDKKLAEIQALAKAFGNLSILDPVKGEFRVIPTGIPEGVEFLVKIIKRQSEAIRDVFRLSNLSDDSQLIVVCDKTIADIEKLIEGDEK